MFKLTPTHLAVAACSLCLANSVPAAVLVNQLDHVTSKTTSSSKGGPGTPNGETKGPIAYDDFTIGSAGTLERIDVWGNVSTVGFGGSKDVVVTIRANYPGDTLYPDIPATGTPLYSEVLPFTNTQGAVGMYGWSLADESTRKFEITLATPFAFEANTKYWVSVQTRQSIGGFEWNYRGSESDSVTPNPDAIGAPAAYDSNESGDFLSIYKQWVPEDPHPFFGHPARWEYGKSEVLPGGAFAVDLAFQLHGTAAGVPEPGSLALVGVVGGGLLLRRRRACR